jgi:hypothetical protein
MYTIISGILIKNSKTAKKHAIRFGTIAFLKIDDAVEIYILWVSLMCWRVSGVQYCAIYKLRGYCNMVCIGI